MKEVKALLMFTILIILFATGLAIKIIDYINLIIIFIGWLFTISMTDFGISPLLEIVIKFSTFIISYLIVGIIFNLIGLFSSKIMKAVYFIISTLIGFCLSYIVYIFQEKFNVIKIVIFSLIGLFVIIYVLKEYTRKRN